MKVPLAQDPFPPVTLSASQQHQLKWLSDALLEETLVENEDFAFRSNQVRDKSKWKHVMSREDVSIYKHVGKGELGGYTPDISLYEPEHEPRTKHWRVPTCVGVGTLPGTLEELLYGLLAVSKTDTEIRTTYINDQAGDARVVANVIVPTESDPLCSLLVRWSLMDSIIYSLGAMPRDVVNMESIGTRVLPSGERIGYIMLQSVDVPGCEELTQLGIMRTRFSSGFIFRDTGLGSVELYMRGFVEPGGSLPTSIAVFTSCMSLVAIWRVMLAGQNKKLAYVARTNLLAKRSVSDGAKQVADVVKTCSLCLRRSSALRSLAGCDLCSARVCSRCIDKRKLTHVKSIGKLVRVSTRICKSCLTTVSSMNVRDIALNEHVLRSPREIRQNVVYGGAPGLGVGGSRDTIWSTTTVSSSQSQFRDSMASSASYASDALSVSSDFDNMVIMNEGVDVSAAESSGESSWQAWIRMNDIRISDDEEPTVLAT